MAGLSLARSGALSLWPDGGREARHLGERAARSIIAGAWIPYRAAPSAAKHPNGRGFRRYGPVALPPRSAIGHCEATHDPVGCGEASRELTVERTQADPDRETLDSAAWSSSTSSSSVPGRPGRRRRSASHGGARACCSPTGRAFRATSRAAAGSPAARCRQAPCDVAPVVEHVVDRVRAAAAATADGSSGRHEPLILMTQRRRLDALPGRAGGRAPAPSSATASRVEDDRARTRRASRRTVGGEHGRAPGVVVGADGANGVVARAAGLDAGHRPRRRARGERRRGASSAARPFERTAWIELGTVPGGYGWVFPKGDHANLGVGGWGGEGPRLREHLDRLARAHGLVGVDLTDVRGHRLPMRRLGAAPRGGPRRCSSATPRASSTRSRATACTRRSRPAGSRPRRSSRASLGGYGPAAGGGARPSRGRLVGGEARDGPQRRGLLLGGPIAGRVRRRRGAARRRGRGIRPRRAGWRAPPLRLLARSPPRRGARQAAAPPDVEAPATCEGARLPGGLRQSGGRPRALKVCSASADPRTHHGSRSPFSPAPSKQAPATSTSSSGSRRSCASTASSSSSPTTRRSRSRTSRPC